MENYEKKKVVLKFLQDIDPTYKMIDIEVGNDWGNQTEYKTPEGTFCCMDEDEREQSAIEYEEGLIDDIGIVDLLSGGVLDYHDYLDTDWFEDAMKESYESYCDDIEYESSSRHNLFDNRLQEEIFENVCDMDFDILDEVDSYITDKEAFRDEDDLELIVENLRNALMNTDEVAYSEDEDGIPYFKDEGKYSELIEWLNDNNRDNSLCDEMIDSYFNERYEDIDTLSEYALWFSDYDDEKDEYKEQYVEKMCSYYDDAIEWATDNFGKEYVDRLIKDGTISVDVEELTKDITKYDGYGSLLSSWDGEEHEVCVHDTTYYLYKQDNDRLHRNSNDEFILDEESIRNDFKTALEEVEEGTELSGILGYGFSDEDIQNLAIVHRDNEELREKIEDLLTDCNFHSECGLLSEGKYDELIKEEEIER